MINFNSIEELVHLAKEEHCPISQIVMAWEAENNLTSQESQIEAMRKNWQVMVASLQRGCQNQEKSLSG